MYSKHIDNELKNLLLQHETIKDCIANSSGSQRQRSWLGSSNTTLFERFCQSVRKCEVDTSYGFLNIKANIKMFTDSRWTGGWKSSLHNPEF